MKPNCLNTLLLCAGLALALPAAADAWLIKDVRVFDGERTHAGRSVLIDGGTIVSANFRGTAPANAKVVSGAGRTLLPGLIDAHVHAYRHLDLPLLFGVTTQIDMFTPVAIMQDLTGKMARGENHGQADLFSAGTLVTAPGGHGTQFGVRIPTLERPEDALAFVDARIAEGSHFIKIVLEDGGPGKHFKTLSLPTMKAAVDAAHLRGKLAVVHISSLQAARAALDAGADGLVHLFAAAKMKPGDLDAFVALAKAKKAFIIPTFSVLESAAGMRADDLIDDPRMARLLDREQMQTLKAPYSNTPHPALLEDLKATTAALARAGVPVLAGTDAGNAGTQYGVSLHHELGSLVAAGLTPQQALAAATSAPARAFRLATRGRIADGFKADLLLVEGDPSTDIGATRRIVEIWKDGETVSGLREKQQHKVARELLPTSSNPLRLPADGRISQFSKEQLASPVGVGWMPSTDSFMGGKSTVTLQVLDTGGDGQAPLAVNAQVAPGFPYPWAGVAFMPGTQPMQAADLSAARVLRFRVRGDGQAYNVAMLSKGVMIPATVAFTTSGEWKEVAIPFADFKGIDASMLTMIAFNAGPKIGTYGFQIADVRLLNE